MSGSYDDKKSEGVAMNWTELEEFHRVENRGKHGNYKGGRRKNPSTTINDLEIEKLYLEGLSISEIAKIYNCGETTINRALKRRKVKTRKKTISLAVRRACRENAKLMHEKRKLLQIKPK